ncbi:Sec-independent protein translocase subunit TatA [Longispora sp. K20-0274]|uniref:Sec-independent protein translocase subunit TatA n=1 Tax=Longispora sp. K20-0274 TaxID=3088255 RepID=UPI00399A4B49
MGSLQPWHWAVIIIAVVLLFGSKRLPDAARSLGKSMRIIKAETKGLAEDGNAAQAQQPPVAPPAAPYVQPAPPAAQPPAAPPRDTSI